MVAPSQQIGLIDGNAVEDFLRQVNYQVLVRARHFAPDLEMKDAVQMLRYVAPQLGSLNSSRWTWTCTEPTRGQQF